MPLAASALVSGSSAARCRYVKSTSPSRSRGYSLAIGSLTLSSRSDRVQTSSTETIVAPLRELERAGRRQRHPVLVGLDLLGNPDPHARRSLSPPMDPSRRDCGSIVTQSARSRDGHVTLFEVRSNVG